MFPLKSFFAFLVVFVAMDGVARESEIPLSVQGGGIEQFARKPHPRSLPDSVVVPLSVADLLAKKVKQMSLERLPADADAGVLQGVAINADQARILRTTTWAAYAEEERVLLAAFAWHAVKDPLALHEAKRRALNLANWSPRGASSHFLQDQTGRSVTWTLALAYDWLYEELSAGERVAFLEAIRPRVVDMLSAPVSGYPTGWAGIDWGRKLDRSPYDSHGANALARLSVICTVLLGDDEIFDRCAKAVLPRYLDRPIPWGGGDGGFAPGTAYAHWGVLDTHFVVWHLLRNAIGVDLWKRDWAKGYLNYIAYFLPPGTPTGLFGDAAEVSFPHLWATQAKAYASSMPSPLADWYVQKLSGENALHLALLLSHRADQFATVVSFPKDAPHSVHLKDIGWVAMHSDLSDPSRSSVYFKSSNFGSFNHSHADQNSFVIHANGKVLAADSGFYDNYNSQHWRFWYKQTAAHNAITFDGGQGQLHDNLAAKGVVTLFKDFGDYVVVSGDATEAYGRSLTRAVRSMVYVRPGLVLVFDGLASSIPRIWEWNIHALSRMLEAGSGALVVNQGGIRMCVTMLEAPDGAFSQTDRFSVEPLGKFSNQWHARYVVKEKSKVARFVSLMDIGCLGPEVSIVHKGEALELHVGNRSILVSDNFDMQVSE